MNKKPMGLIKGVGISMIAGGATAVISSMMMNSNGRKYRKMANRAVKTAGDIMDTISNSINKM